MKFNVDEAVKFSQLRLSIKGRGEASGKGKCFAKVSSGKLMKILSFPTQKFLTHFVVREKFISCHERA